MLMLRWHEAVNLSETQPYEYGLMAHGGQTQIQMLYAYTWLSFKAMPAAEELLHLPDL